MGLLDLVDKFVNEHGSATIRGERIAQLREFSSALDLKLKDAQTRIDVLEREARESGVREKNLESQLAAARSEINRLNQQRDNAKKLTPEELSILKFMSNARDFVFADDVVGELNIEAARVDWLLGRLVGSQYIHETANVPPRYRIEQKGKEAVFSKQP